ncbi:hypothetical protein LSH36_2337g00004, partial [Paralvinella palmiformis]
PSCPPNLNGAKLSGPNSHLGRAVKDSYVHVCKLTPSMIQDQAEGKKYNLNLPLSGVCEMICVFILYYSCRISIWHSKTQHQDTVMHCNAPVEIIS